MSMCWMRLSRSLIQYKDNILPVQWNPSIKATQDGGLSKEVAWHGGKIHMICKEWCMEMDQILQL